MSTAKTRKGFGNSWGDKAKLFILNTYIAPLTRVNTIPLVAITKMISPRKYYELVEHISDEKRGYRAWDFF